MKEIKYENRIVAYIDILGFKDIVNESVNDLSKLSLIHDILTFLKTKESPDEWSLKLIEIEEDAQKKGVEKFDVSKNIACTCFSDTLEPI